MARVSAFLWLRQREHSMLSGIIRLALGAQHSMILEQHGRVWCAGVTSHEPPSRHFDKVIFSGATALAAGIDHSLALMQDGRVWAMGSNLHGQLGDGTRTRKDRFFFVRRIAGAKAVAAGGYHSILLTQSGGVWVTGWNKYRQLGDASTYERTKFFRVIGDGAKAVAVAAGDLHSVVLKQDGSVWAAGRNDHGQLGVSLKNDADRSIFVKVMSDSAADVAAGGYHSMVLKQDGSVWTTGWNEYGQLGDGSTAGKLNYVQVASGAQSVATGSRHSMMLKHDGSLWATGYNSNGQLGDGSKIDRENFVLVIPAYVNIVAAGAFHTMVLKGDGSIWATGSNQDGQFGDGTRFSEKSFIDIAPFDYGTRPGTMTCTWFDRYDLEIPQLRSLEYVLLPS